MNLIIVDCSTTQHPSCLISLSLPPSFSHQHHRREIWTNKNTVIALGNHIAQACFTGWNSSVMHIMQNFVYHCCADLRIRVVRKQNVVTNCELQQYVAQREPAETDAISDGPSSILDK